MGLFKRSPSEPKEAWLDRLGVTASIGCAIHCFLIGIFFLLFPGIFEATHYFGNLHFLETDWFHLVMAAIVFPVALYSIGRGYRLHKYKSTIIFGSIGLILIMAGLLAHPHPAEALLTMLGGLSLALAHFLNLRGVSLKHFKSRKNRTVV